MFIVDQSGNVDHVPATTKVDTTGKTVRDWYTVGSHTTVTVVFPKQPSQAAKSALSDLMRELL